jgi:hypothetical protein
VPQVVAVFTGRAVGHGQNEPPASGILQNHAQEGRDRRGIGPGQARLGQVVGHAGEDLLQPTLIFAPQQCGHQFALVRALSANNSPPMLALAHRLVPETVEVLAQHLAGGPPALPCAVTPAGARERLTAHV